MYLLDDGGELNGTERRGKALRCTSPRGAKIFCLFGGGRGLGGGLADLLFELLCLTFRGFVCLCPLLYKTAVLVTQSLGTLFDLGDLACELLGSLLGTARIDLDPCLI